MTEYALAPNSKFDTANSPYRTPRVMLEQGLLSAYRVRTNGTMRHLELYPLASTARETAEYVSDRVDYDGASVQAVARELHVSTPTIRRYLEGLELTEEIESGEWDGLHFDSAGQPVFDTAWVESDEDTAEEPVCGCAAEALGNSWHTPGCDKFVSGANEPRVTPAAAPAKPRTRRTRAVRTTEEIIKGQGLPYPTDEERAAALADVATKATQMAAAPTRTLADPVAAKPAATAPVAPQGRDLAVCYCNGLGQHAPGAVPTCKFAGSGAALLRRPRSH